MKNSIGLAMLVLGAAAAVAAVCWGIAVSAKALAAGCPLWLGKSAGMAYLFGLCG